MSPAPQRLDIALLLATALVSLAAPLLLCWRPGPQLPRSTGQLLARLDSDGDGRVSPAELRRASTGRPGFQQLDLDRSGLLEPVEVELILVAVNPHYRGRER